MATPGDSGQYFAASPDVASSPQSIELVLLDVYLSLLTDRGVFAASRVDAGTKYLLQEHGSIGSGVATVLDLGCGYGPIALTAAIRAPHAQVWGVDVNERALGLARQNAERAEVSNVRFGFPDDVPPDLCFDLIISNPPIRIGKSSLHELLRRWLVRLTVDGVARMVVQKHLGSDSLATWLSEQGWATQRLGSRGGYRILETEARS